MTAFSHWDELCLWDIRDDTLSLLEGDQRIVTHMQYNV
jgi:hypothetical protein